jgi:hypothetical protein
MAAGSRRKKKTGTPRIGLLGFLLKMGLRLARIFIRFSLSACYGGVSSG